MDQSGYINESKLAHRIAKTILLALVGFSISCATVSPPHILDPRPAQARLQAGGSIADEVGRLVQPRIQSGQYDGVAVGVITPDGLTHFQGFGRTGIADDDGGPQTNTIFQIGSISKIFIVSILAVLEKEGTLHYDDTVRGILPPEIPLAEEAGRVTLHELVTHTGGFPREPVSRLQMRDLLRFEFAGEDMYAHLNKPFLYEYLRTCHLPPKENRRYEYSNIGYGLLAHLIEVKTGRRFEELLEEKICRPLHLRDTTFVLTDEQRTRLAVGHAGAEPRFVKRGRPIPPWNMTRIMAPVGGLYSTVDDLLIFLEANLGMLGQPLDTVLSTTHRTQFKLPQTEIALGWQKNYFGDPPEAVIFKHGLVSGYEGYMGFAPDKRLGVVVLCNTFGWEDKLGNNLVVRLRGGLPDTSESRH